VVNLATKVFLALSAIAFIAAVAYGVAVGDRAGADLLVAAGGGFAVLGAVTGLALAPDSAPRVAADAPAPERRNAFTEADVPSASAWPFVGAVAAVAMALAVATGAPWIAAAGGFGVVAAAGWLGHVWREHPSFSRRVRERVVERLLAPLAMPLFATLGALFIAAMVSRVLLAVSDTASWVTALCLAAALLVVLWTVSARPRLQSSALIGVAVLGLLGMTLAGALGANAGERTFHPHEPTHPTVAMSARNVQFNKKTLEFPAETAVVIKFRNFDAAVYHNVAFYTSTDASRKPIWAGKPIPGGLHVQYLTMTPDPGTYAFVCDFHPTMTGTLVITPKTSSHEAEEH
jgi:plastocyanin